MFVGEMGCWIVVGLSILYERLIAPRLSRNQSPLLAGGYRPIRGEDEGLEDEDHTIDEPDMGQRNSNKPTPVGGEFCFWPRPLAATLQGPPL